MTKLFKLISGEEILATVKDETPTSFTIVDAVTLVYQPAGDGKMTVGFAPFMAYASGPITLYASSVATEAVPNDQMKQEHTRIFSNIVIAPAGSIR
jgi:hypothetical protein